MVRAPVGVVTGSESPNILAEASATPAGSLRCEPVWSPIRTGLERCGLVVEDTTIVLSRLANGATLSQVVAQMGAGEILAKRTLHGRKHLVEAVRRRYLSAAPPLPSARTLGTILPTLSAPVAAAQVLLPYLLAEDRAAFEVVIEAILPRRRAGLDRLCKSDILDALAGVFRRHEKAPWNDAVSRRWAEGLLSILREVGILGRSAERERLLPFVVRPEAFAFHLWGLYDAGLRGRTLRETPFWRLLLLGEDEPRAALRTVADRGWWRYTTVGVVEEIIPVATSLTAWGKYDLERHAV